MSDDQRRQPGRFLNDEDDNTPAPGPVLSQTQFPSPSTGNRQAIGGANPFQPAAPTPFGNPPTGQFPTPFPNPSTGAIPTPFSNPPTGQFPASGSGSFPSAQSGQFPNTHTGQFANPLGAPTPFPNSQTGQFANPLGAPTPFSNSQTGQFANPLGAPTSFPNSPTGQFMSPGTTPIPIVGAPVPASVISTGSTKAKRTTPPDTRMRTIYGAGGAGVGLLLGLMLGILNSGLEQMTFTQGLGVTIQMAVWFMLLFGIACAFKPERVEFILRKHGIMD